MGKPNYEELAKQWPGKSHDEWIAIHPGLMGVSLITRAELAFLLNYLPPAGRFLEIGTACGVTAALVAKARPDITVLCVDNFSMPWPDTDCMMDWRDNKQTNMRLWFGTTRELIDCLAPAGRFDMILVDADHNFEPTLASLHEASSLLVPGGTITAHDWMNPGWPDVAPAVDEFCRQSGFSIIESHRLMVALRKS